MDFKRLTTFLLISSFMTACGVAAPKGVHGGKTSRELDVVNAEVPPPVEMEEIRRSDPHYKPTKFTDIPGGFIVMFRGNFEIDAKNRFITNTISETQRIGMGFVFPKVYGDKKVNLKGRSLKVTKIAENNKPEVLLTYIDESLQESDELVKLYMWCVYYGERLNTKLAKDKAHFLNRPCTIQEFSDTLMKANALVLDFADMP